MKKIWMNRPKSFEEAEKFDIQYYLNMTPEERLDIMQLLRDEYFKMNGVSKDEIRKGLRRFYKIIEQK
ncbi:hypothetical protein KAU32_03920 [bacterium]|nr:hypothetical protein [bacterium]